MKYSPRMSAGDWLNEVLPIVGVVAAGLLIAYGLTWLILR